MLPLLLEPPSLHDVLSTRWIKSFVSSKSFTKNSSRFTHTSLLDNRFFLHALNGPLTNLSLNLESALQTPPEKPELVTEHLTQAISNLKHLHNMFQLLTTETLKQRQVFELHRSLKEVVIQHHQPRRQRFIISAINLDSSSYIRGNIFYFQEALACLINNAFEAYGESRSTKHVLVAAYTTRKKAVIYIGDVAQGMDWLVKRLAFVKGFTSKKEGTGLGLVLAKKLIEQHLAGKLEIASFSKAGTLCMITLPLRT